MRAVPVFFLALVASAASAQVTTVETPFQERVVAKSFEGSEYRDVVNEATLALKDKRTSAAGWKKLEPVLAYCDGKQSSHDVTYVSVSSQAEAELFGKSRQGPRVVFVDMACPYAYKLAGFVAVRDDKANLARRYLDQAIVLAPYWADPHVELGFLLNSLADRVNALASYRRALELADANHEGESASKPIALRGIGWTLTEMGDFDGATAAYKASLEVDPANPTAISELAYVDGLRTKGGLAPKSPAFAVAGTDVTARHERDRVLEYTRFLEDKPLDKHAPTMRAWLVSWITDSPEVSVLVCDILGPIPATRMPNDSELLAQMMFGNAAFQIEHADDNRGLLAQQVAGLESALKAYQRFVEDHAEARIPYFENLLKQQQAGTLAEFMAPVIKKNCSGKAEAGGRGA